MNRLLLYIIGMATPPSEREWVVGDTVEEFDRVERAQGPDAARRWLRCETWRVFADGPRHRLAVRPPWNAIRNAPGDGLMSALWQDVRHARRLLGRSPGFTTIAIATLALGIGANTAMFSVVNAVLLKRLPFADAERLMLVHMLVPDREAGPGVYHEGVWSYPKYRTFLELTTAFEEVAFFAGRDYILSGDAEPERIRGEVVTERYPAVLGITPILGRSFTYEEVNVEGTPPSVVIGYGLWTRRYGRDPAVVGRTMQVNGTPYTIVGVLPRGFRGLTGIAEVWAPLAALEPSQLTERQSHSYTIVARRKADVPEQTAIAAVRLAGSQVDTQYREGTPPGEAWGATAASLYSSRTDEDIRRASIVVLGAVGFVLLIACVNLTNLLVAKALARRREVAIRVAIGASRWQIARQFAVEGMVLAALGAAGGLAVAAILLNAAATLLPDSEVFFRTSMAPGARRIAGAAGLTRIGASMIGLDAATLLFTCALTVLTALLVSVMPAFQASSLRPSDALKAGGRAGTGRGLHAYGTRAVLVTLQIALALVLLTGAGLMIKSAARLQGTGIGVNPDDVLTVRFDLPRASYSPETGRAFQAQLVDRVRSIPGVASAGLANCPPVSGGCNGTGIWFGRPPRRTGTEPLVGIHWATPDYFSTLGIRLLQGRPFSDGDRVGQPKVVLVNETAARTFWPNESPIGKAIAVGQGGFHDGAEVIGVVADVRYRTIEAAATADVYVPALQSYQARMRLFVRSGLDTGGLVNAIRRELRALDPNLPISEIKPMEERVADAMWRTRVGAWLLSAFAALASLLTAIGIFGVMAETVAQRTGEIGIRMALGAQVRDVLGIVLRRAALITLAGLTAGVAAALGLTRLIGALLYQVEAHDPGTFMGVAVFLGIVALAACYVPARRATRVDAVVALRQE